MRKLVFVAVALTGLSTAPAMAGLLEDYFAGGGACFARSYDRAHMRGHPDQTVTDIHLGTSPRFSDRSAELVLSFGFTQRGGSTYSGDAYCTGTRCNVEGDGGSFRLAPDGNALKLTVGDFLMLEGEEDFSTDLATSDDRVFLLYPAKASACQ